ncbi:unnamed protein product [Rodentolepis nana]|uniref:Fibronectin type-III domain-containing protein n=1 Tax=Rodentolepis nana TaxID=102285 RepID=A0A0R3T5U0_RODNA|nr:unnamed protein product [Rodentolepis nana]
MNTTVRWKSDNPQDQYKYADVAEVEDAGDASFTIIGLNQNTQYEVAVRSRNDEYGETKYSKTIQARTGHASDDVDHFNAYHTIKAVGYTRSNSLFIIVAACVIGGVVIVINVVVIIYIIRKKQTHGGTAPVMPLSKPRLIPVEKTCHDGSKYGSQYCCDDPNHRHAYGDHFYTPDPLLVGETAQSNPVYGYVRIGDNLSDGVNQPTYVPTFYTNDPNYQQVHHTLLPGFQSPLTSVVEKHFYPSILPPLVPDLLGYTENCYIDQLEALQKGNSPTKRLLLNGSVHNGTLKRSRTSSNWNETPDVVV